MTRDEVLDVLDKLSPLRRKRLDRADVSVHIMVNNRIAVVLPAEKYSPEEQLKLDGKFQNTMTLRGGVHGFLDFAPADAWQGAATPLKGGFH